AEGVGESDRRAVGGVAPVRGDGARSGGVADLTQLAPDFLDPHAPGDRTPAHGGPPQGVEETVGVVLVVGHVHALDAGVAGGDRVIRIGPYGHHATVLDVDFQAAERFTGSDLARCATGLHHSVPPGRKLG